MCVCVLVTCLKERSFQDYALFVDNYKVTQYNNC